MKENGYDLYSSGLRIYTTIDTRLQKYAEQAATKQMEKVQQTFNNHWRGMQLGAMLRAMKSQDSLRVLLNVSPSIRS